MSSYDLIWYLINLILNEQEKKLDTNEKTKRRLVIIFSRSVRYYTSVFLQKKN